MAIAGEIGHVHLKVSDLARAARFYTEVLGFRVTERVGPYLFLTAGWHHHDIALQELGADAARPQPHMVGLFHFAIELPDRRALAEAYRTLRDHGVELEAAVDYGISQALYFADPDGNGIELYVDTRGEGRPLWGGRTARLDLDALLAEAGAGATGS